MIFNRGNRNEMFEVLLKKEAANFRMYPSEKVWDNLRDEIQPKTKWPALITIFVSIVLALTISTIINYPVEKVGTNKVVSLVSIKSEPNKNINISTPVFLAQNFYNKKIVAKNIDSKIITEKVKNIQSNSNIEIEKNLVIENHQNNFELVETKFNDGILKENLEKLNVEQVLRESKQQLENNLVVSEKNIDVSNFIKNEITTTQVKVNLNENGLDFKTKKTKSWNNKWSIQYYVTLSNSYRTLDDDKSRSNYTSTLTDRIALNKNVNDVVIHKPLLGAEIGGAVLYKLTKNLYLKAGIQFDIRQYNIDAFNAYGAANISYINNNQLNTYSAISGFSTNFENALGAKTSLQNKLYELSIPVGLEWNVVDGHKWGLSLTGSLQPTVALNRSNYIVSTDYKYYTDASPFFRRYNINANTGMYFTLKTKNLKWFLGPQVRFQQLPTYNDLYPIKEYRIDYGVKIGFTKPL